MRCDAHIMSEYKVKIKNKSRIIAAQLLHCHHHHHHRHHRKHRHNFIDCDIAFAFSDAINSCFTYISAASLWLISFFSSQNCFTLLLLLLWLDSIWCKNPNHLSIRILRCKQINKQIIRIAKSRALRTHVIAPSILRFMSSCSEFVWELEFDCFFFIFRLMIFFSVPLFVLSN